MKLKVLTLDFEFFVELLAMQKHSGFFLKFAVNLKQNSLKFPAFLELTNSDVIKFYFQQFYGNFPDHSTIMTTKKVIFIIPISQQCCIQFCFELRNIFIFFYLIKTSDSDEKHV